MTCTYRHTLQSTDYNARHNYKSVKDTCKDFSCLNQTFYQWLHPTFYGFTKTSLDISTSNQPSRNASSWKFSLCFLYSEFLKIHIAWLVHIKHKSWSVLTKWVATHSRLKVVNANNIKPDLAQMQCVISLTMLHATMTLWKQSVIYMYCLVVLE